MRSIHTNSRSVCPLSSRTLLVLQGCFNELVVRKHLTSLYLGLGIWKHTTYPTSMMTGPATPMGTLYVRLIYKSRRSLHIDKHSKAPPFFKCHFDDCPYQSRSMTADACITELN